MQGRGESKFVPITVALFLCLFYMWHCESSVEKDLESSGCVNVTLCVPCIVLQCVNVTLCVPCITLQGVNDQRDAQFL